MGHLFEMGEWARCAVDYNQLYHKNRHACETYDHVISRDLLNDESVICTMYMSALQYLLNDGYKALL